MTDCIFCRIAKGEAPVHKIYEDQDFLAFLDINPFTEGHTLVIPKKHYRWVWDYPKIDLYFKITGKVVNHFRKVSEQSWVSAVVWGQMVSHAHIQILPWPNKLGLTWKRNKLNEIKAKELVKKFSF